MLDHLLPAPGIQLAGCIHDGEQYIRADSLQLMLATMELNNAKHPKHKPEYDEVLTYLRNTLSKIDWSKP